MPLGLGLGFKINGKSYIGIPMAIEEPSVIAACSSIAKLISDKGTGFLCQSTPPVMIGQVVFQDLTDLKSAHYTILKSKALILAKANESCEGMVKRGGGVVDVRFRILDPLEGMAVIEVLVNVCDSMGANVVNTIAEAIAPYL